MEKMACGNRRRTSVEVGEKMTVGELIAALAKEASDGNYTLMMTEIGYLDVTSSEATVYPNDGNSSSITVYRP